MRLDKTLKFYIKTSNVIEDISLSIQNDETPRANDPIIYYTLKSLQDSLRDLFKVFQVSNLYRFLHKLCMVGSPLETLLRENKKGRVYSSVIILS